MTADAAAKGILGGSRREVDLLLSTACGHLDSVRTERIQALTRAEINWDFVMRSALTNKVRPLLYKSLNTACPGNVPPAVLKQLQSHYYANAAKNLFLAGELLNILRLFEDHQVHAIPYKGPTLAASIYGNLAFREIGDLDILVHKRDYAAGRRVLMSRGFRSTIEHEWEEEFRNDSGTFAVDLHQRIAASDLPSPINFDYLWKRLRPVALAGTTVATLCVEDSLLMLSIQLTKDMNLQLSKVCDIAELLRVNPQLNWTQVLKESKRLGGERMLFYGVRLASDLLGAALPQELASEISNHSALDGLVAHVRQQLLHRDDSVSDLRPADGLHWLLQESRRDKLRRYYRYLSNAVVPCELDRRFVPLPRRLSFLYFGIRPIRLIGKYALLLVRIKKQDARSEKVPPRC